MKIEKTICQQLLTCHKVPPEMGGILGATKGEIIDICCLDSGVSGASAGIYRPNVGMLNECIEKWEEKGISFCGIFHTHAEQWPTLSGGDREYIEIILRAMPPCRKELYFPIVIPEQSIKAFRAWEFHDQVYITNDDIEII